MSLTSGFASGLIEGLTGTEYLRDFTHGQKLIGTDAFALAPGYKFNFHVYFTLNVPGPASDAGLVGALVKSVQLPSYSLDTKEYIQYNRKRNVHNKIEYRPVVLKLHDDASDTVRSLWYNYYNYYFADSSYEYDPNGGPAYAGRDIYNEHRTAGTWGMTTKSSEGMVKQGYFKDIKIYGMSRGNYVLYTLVNPVITEWTHDTYDYSQTGGVMEHSMSVKYEAVKYSKGKVTDNILGFANPQRYDTTPSPLSKPGSTASIFGQSGLLDTIAGASTDLAGGNILGAVLGVARQATTFNNADLSFGDILKTDVVNEVKTQLPNVIRSVANKPGGIFISSGSVPKTSPPTAGPRTIPPYDITPRRPNF